MLVSIGSCECQKIGSPWTGVTGVCELVCTRKVHTFNLWAISPATLLQFLKFPMRNMVFILMGLPFHVTWCFSTVAFNRLSLFCILSVLTVIWRGFFFVPSMRLLYSDRQLFFQDLGNFLLEFYGKCQNGIFVFLFCSWLIDLVFS